MKDKLRRHEKTHEDNRERSHECSVCGATFYDKENLKHHLNIHYGTKDNKCTVCDKAFLTKSELSSHEKTHKENC